MLLPLLLSISFSAIAAQSNSACDGDDLDCVKRLLAEKILDVESLRKQLAISQEQVKTANQLIDIWKDVADRGVEAGREAMAALRPAPWYQAPVLWFGVGFTVAAALTVAIVYAIIPATSPR
jgi:hypothetical protein